MSTLTHFRVKKAMRVSSLSSKEKSPKEGGVQYTEERVNKNMYLYVSVKPLQIREWLTVDQER
jgi:hypothetical protein